MANNKRISEALLLQQLKAFWFALGVVDEGLRHQLAQRCLTHIVVVLPEVEPAKASRIVLNQAQHFFDQALATHMGLDARQDRNQLAVFRAQLLHQKIHTDFLFATDGIHQPNLSIRPEMAVPPESPLTMSTQTLTFAFMAKPTTLE